MVRQAQHVSSTSGTASSVAPQTISAQVSPSNPAPATPAPASGGRKTAQMIRPVGRGRQRAEARSCSGGRNRCPIRQGGVAAAAPRGVCGRTRALWASVRLTDAPPVHHGAARWGRGLLRRWAGACSGVRRLHTGVGRDINVWKTTGFLPQAHGRPATPPPASAAAVRARAATPLQLPPQLHLALPPCQNVTSVSIKRTVCHTTTAHQAHKGAARRGEASRRR